MRMLALKIQVERWPIAKAFTISRGSKTEAVVVVVELSDGEFVGRGECVPYARYGESVESVIGEIKKAKTVDDRISLQSLMRPGAARNGFDCAFWDLEAKRAGRPVSELAGLPTPKPLMVSYTLSLDTPEAMAMEARKVSDRPLLKIKLGADGDRERLMAVREAAPKTRLVVDANEGWTEANLVEKIEGCKACGVSLIEQPLPAGKDDYLAEVPHAIPLCADESVFERSSLPNLKGKYDVINVKLDKTGGLTEALATAALAKDMGFSLMVGCMVSTSLSMAPAFLVAQEAAVIDLDGPLLLAKDRPDGLRYEGGLVYPPTCALWG